MRYSEKALRIAPSATLEISAKAAQLRSEGFDVVGFGAGEPDYDTPEYIKEAAHDAISSGKTKYTAAAGIKELREAVAARLKRRYGLEYDFKDIVISNGAKHSLFNAFQATVNRGDEVIIATPYWVTYPELVRMADGVPVFVECAESNNFEPRIEDLKAAITDKTKVILVTNPSNPCGCVYSRKSLEDIAAVAKEYDLHVIADEIYDELVYDGDFVSFPTLSEDAKERTILVNGMSKTYAMTGWRIGYTASNGKAASVMSSYQSHASSNPNSIAQYASVAALNGPQDDLAEMVAEYKLRRDLIVELINGINGLTCRKPQGAFYALVNISAVKGKSIDGETVEGSMSFCDLLLRHKYVAAVPGLPFGADDYIRLSYATSRDVIEEGCRRIAEFIDMLK